MGKSDFIKEIGIVGRGATRGQFALGQNYPNPFTNNTTISFSLAELSIVWMDVYNASGTKIARILNTKLDAGEHIVELSRVCSGEVLSPGNYAYQLNVENSKGLHRHIKVMTVV